MQPARWRGAAAAAPPAAQDGDTRAHRRCCLSLLAAQGCDYRVARSRLSRHWRVEMAGLDRRALGVLLLMAGDDQLLLSFVEVHKLRDRACRKPVGIAPFYLQHKLSWPVAARGTAIVCVFALLTTSFTSWVAAQPIRLLLPVLFPPTVFPRSPVELWPLSTCAPGSHHRIEPP